MCSAPVLLDSNLFWICDYAAEHEIAFTCNKTIGIIFCPKSYEQPAPSNAFLHGVGYVYNFLTKWNTLVCWYMPHWRMVVIFRDKWNRYAVLCSKQAPRHIRSVLSCSKKYYFKAIACQCMLANCGVNTHWLVWSARPKFFWGEKCLIFGE